MPAWRPLVGLIRSLSARGRDPSQSCRLRSSLPRPHRDPPTEGWRWNGCSQTRLDYVVGVDPHRDVHALAIVHAGTGGAVGSAQVTANERGYAQALRLAEREASGRRGWAIEGTGSYGPGSPASWPSAASGCSRSGAEEGAALARARRTRSTRSGLPAACSVRRSPQPRAAGEREALRALMVARAGSLAAKNAAPLPAAGPARDQPRTAAQRAALTDAGAASQAPSGGCAPTGSGTRSYAAR